MQTTSRPHPQKKVLPTWCLDLVGTNRPEQAADDLHPTGLPVRRF